MVRDEKRISNVDCGCCGGGAIEDCPDCIDGLAPISGTLTVSGVASTPGGSPNWDDLNGVFPTAIYSRNNCFQAVESGLPDDYFIIISVDSSFLRCIFHSAEMWGGNDGGFRKSIGSPYDCFATVADLAYLASDSANDGADFSGASLLWEPDPA